MARVPIDPEPGLLSWSLDWQPGMDQEYRHIPSQHCDPLRAMEAQCVWQCTQPRQNLRNSFDKSKYYKPTRFYKDTGRARFMDASRFRDRTLQRFCDVLLRKQRSPAGEISITHRDILRLLERSGLDETYRKGGLVGIARHVGLTRRQREVFVLWPYFTQEQIANQLGLTQAAVSQRLANVVDRCRRWQTRTQNLIQAPLSLDRERMRRQSVFKRENAISSDVDYKTISGGSR